MKKIILTIVAVIAFSGMAFSQISLGGRFYAGFNSGAEVSLLYDMSQTNRIEADLGASFGYRMKHYPGPLGGYDAAQSYYVTTATGAYHWQFNIIKGLGWFIGPAAQIGLGADRDHDFYLRLAAGAQAGVQYKFDFPLQVSLDVRPMVDFVHLNDPKSLFDFGVAAGVRYCF